MSLEELYQDVILEHSQSPRRAESLKIVTDSTIAKNPLCGDMVKLEVHIEDGIVKDLCCETNGCAISTAAGSIMASEIVGKSREEAIALTENFILSLKDNKELCETSEDLCILSQVGQYPTRIKCAVLPWNALREMLTD
jgi:nitrogen fixation NifU-like protein